MFKKLFPLIGVLLCGVAVSRANLMTRQPRPFPEGMDTWFGSVYNKTAVHNNVLRDGGWGDMNVSLIRFNLSGLPQTATQAIVYLYIMPPRDGSTTTPITWWLLANQWHSGTIGWSTTMTGWNVISSAAPGNSAGWYGVDITGYYNLWRAGNAPVLNYGFELVPQYINDRFNIFHSSSSSLTGARPLLYVFYNPQANDNVLKLKWPLATPYTTRVVTQGYDVPWSTGKRCPEVTGPIKRHNGTDFRASAGTAVYAAEDGVVKEITDGSKDGWAYNIVLEHNHPAGGKYTTVYWHVNPVSDVFQSLSGGFVPKGMQIGSVADLRSDTHFHFGVRIGAYLLNVSGTGALPVQTCTDTGKSFSYPGFPAGFINPDSTSYVLFQ